MSHQKPTGKGPLHRARQSRRTVADFRDASATTASDNEDDTPSPDEPASVESEAEAAPKTKDDRFYPMWDKFTRKPPPPRTSKIESLDEDAEGHHKPAAGRNKDGMVSRENAATSFEDAAETCRQKVHAIVAECKRLNKKYHDPLFDLRSTDSLASLTGMINGEPHFIGQAENEEKIADVKRVVDIFKKPQFFIDGATANDVQQGEAGDCWFLASVTALLGMPKSIERLCVERDEQVGVYGFCFHRDGEWISSVVDDRLCLKFHPDQRHVLLSYDSNNAESRTWMPKRLVESLHKGPDALFFARCRSVNETWLPLLEKAYAKAHLSYQAIEGGITGDGIEDLTGGINSSIPAEDVLDKDRLWSELERVNTDFLFGCGGRVALYADQEDAETKGVVTSHAYTVLNARTVKHKVAKHSKEERTTRLLKLRNPWGRGEWTGAWSDGSKEWTSETMKELDHSFGDDGIFWISLEDFLKAYPRVDRTRLFGPEWTVTQQWTTVSVPRTINYSDTQYLPTVFKLHIAKPGPVAILLSQPDDRYFEAMRGRYTFDLHFRVYQEGKTEYLVRSMSRTASGRSVSVEVDCEPGVYLVKLKLTPYREDDRVTAADVIKAFDQWGTRKILNVGTQFDLAHSRGRLREMEIAEMNRRKDDTKAKEHEDMRSVRDLERARRHKQKLAKQRIAAKERAKAKAKSKVDQDQTVADEAVEDHDAGDAVSKDPSISGESQSQPQRPSAEGGASEKSALGDLPVIVKKVEECDSVAPSASRATQLDESSKRPEPEELDKATPVSSDSGEQSKKQAEPGPAVAKEKDIDHNTESRENASDFGSLADDDFSWDSEIDGPVDEEAYGVSTGDDDEDLYGPDDWFALATIGLRVYSKDPEMSVKVEHTEDGKRATVMSEYRLERLSPQNTFKGYGQSLVMDTSLTGSFSTSKASYQICQHKKER